MKLEYVHWRNWDAIRCVSRHVEMVAGASPAPTARSMRRLGR
jgi:hypothetical protein